MKKTIIVSKKTEEQFVSAEEHINVNLSGESKVMFTLTREDGTTKEVSESTFKRWYKTVEVEIQEVEIKNSKKTGHQKIAAANITNAYNWIVGGYENDVHDGNSETMPAPESMFAEVYDEAMNSKYERVCAAATTRRRKCVSQVQSSARSSCTTCSSRTVMNWTRACSLTRHTSTMKSLSATLTSSVSPLTNSAICLTFQHCGIQCRGRNSVPQRQEAQDPRCTY